MFFELLTEDEQNQIFNEMACNTESLYSYLSILYAHMLKYQYQQNKQSTSWIYTIRDKVNEINKILSKKTNFANKIDYNTMNKCYLVGVRIAMKDTKYSADKFPNSVPDEYDFKLVRDLKYIYSFLKRYAYSDEAKKFVSNMEV